MTEEWDIMTQNPHCLVTENYACKGEWLPTKTESSYFHGSLPLLICFLGVVMGTWQ